MTRSRRQNQRRLKRERDARSSEQRTADRGDELLSLAQRVVAAGAESMIAEQVRSRVAEIGNVGRWRCRLMVEHSVLHGGAVMRAARRAVDDVEAANA